jgi:hypothetical protein
MTVHVYDAPSMVRVADGEYLPFYGNGMELGYRISTTTPTYVQYTGGPYFHGELGGWTYLTTLPVARGIHLTLETDEDAYRTLFRDEPSGTQWLNRATLDWQINRDSAFDVGLRRIHGQTLPNAAILPTFAYVNASNVTLAYHFLTLRNEFYVVYGDPNSLSTTPALFLKWVRYVGAPKGT